MVGLFLPLMSFYVDIPDVREGYGYVIIGIVTMSLLVNLLNALIETMIEVYK